MRSTARDITAAAMGEREELILCLSAVVMTSVGKERETAIQRCRAAVRDYRTLAEAWNAAHPEAPIAQRRG